MIKASLCNYYSIHTQTACQILDSWTPHEDMRSLCQKDWKTLTDKRESLD